MIGVADAGGLAVPVGALAIGLLVLALVLALLKSRSAALKMAERFAKEMSESQTRIDLAIRASGLVLWDWNIPARRLEAPELWTRLLGYGQGEFGESEEGWIALVHPDDWPALRASIYAHLKGTTPFYECEGRLRHRDGSWIWLRVLGRVVERGPNGFAIRAAGAILDISERRDSEEALKRSRAELLCVLATTADGILAVDRNRSRILANEQFVRFMKIPPEVLESKEDGRMLAHVRDQVVDPEAFLRRVEQLYGTSDVGSDTVALKDGTVLDRYSAPLIVEEKLAGRIWSFRDVTARHKVEEALRASLREKEVLLREIHHRVKNNMQVITSLLNLQAKSISDGPVRALFDESKARVASMALIHEKLYRSEDLASIDFGAYTAGLARDLVRLYDRPEIGVSVDMGGVFLDVNLGVPCGLIINELISNSLKHAFPGGRRGTIRVGMREGPEGAIVLTVSDDGIGLPAGFDVRESESLGLQLVMVLSGQIRGSVEVGSGPGAAFFIRFAGSSES